MSYKTYKIIEDDKVVFEFNGDAIFCDHCKNSLSIAEALKDIYYKFISDQSSRRGGISLP